MDSMDGLHKLSLDMMIPPDRDAASFSDEELRAMAQIVSPQWITGSVEGQLNLEKAESDAAIGFYGTLTDKTLVDKPVPPENWKHLTSGASRHEGFLVGFQLYSNQQDDPGHAQALATWQALAGEKNSSTLQEVLFSVPGGKEAVKASLPAADELVVLHGSDHVSQFMAHTLAGFNVSMESSPVDQELPSSQWCHDAYIGNLVASMEDNRDLSVDLEGALVEARGPMVWHVHDVLGKISRRKSVRMPHVFYFLGTPGHCTSVHLSILPATDQNMGLMHQVDLSVSAGTVASGD